MALTKNDNAYADVNDGDLYFVSRSHATVWMRASRSEKEAAIVTATMLLNEMSWIGIAVSVDQPLAFPRHGNYFDKMLGVTIPMEGTPRRVFHGCLELAIHILNNEDILEDSGDLDKLEISSLKLTGLRKASFIPAHVRSLIRPLLTSRHIANAWWRAN